MATPTATPSRNSMKYYVRARGTDEVSGPFSEQELDSCLKAGTLTSTHLVLPEAGQTADQLKNHWDFKWLAISSLPGLEGHTPSILTEPTTEQTPEEARSAANQNMLIGGLWCVGGMVVTAVSYAASKGQGGGVYVVAWGAIAFGAIQFFRGFLGRR